MGSKLGEGTQQARPTSSNVGKNKRSDRTYQRIVSLTVFFVMKETLPFCCLLERLAKRSKHEVTKVVADVKMVENMEVYSFMHRKK